MSVRQQVFCRLYEVIESYGFARYDGPILEPAEIYEAKSGREIAELQLYTLTDRSGRRLALRPEMTPSVARMIAANAGMLQFPVRWYSHVNCHRYERPQRGRVREHWQVNVDIFGLDSFHCEIELFELIHDMMTSLGATRDMYVLRVNDRVLLEGILTAIVGIERHRLREVSALIDRWEKVSRSQSMAEAVELGVTAGQFDRLEAALQAGEDIIAELPREIVERSPVATMIRHGGGNLFHFDPLIVRAFEYYTSTVFEVFDLDSSNNRSLFGGGRYGDLVGLFSSQRISGIGFGMGDVTLFDFLKTHNLLPAPKPSVDAVVVPLSNELQGVAREIARQLRSAGIRTRTPLDLGKLGKEISRADDAGARVIVIVAPEEWVSNCVNVRDLRTREQRTVHQDQVTSTALDVLHSPPRS
jgi:histidyl-tRNA synthetase